MAHILKLRKKIKKTTGFSLPTILVSSIVMLSVLLVAVVATSTIRQSLNEQFYDQIASNASEAGVAYAKACLSVNDGIPKWSDALPLKPNTNCSGVVQGSLPTYVMDDTDGNNLQATFVVSAPSLSNGKASDIVVSGYANLIRTLDSSVWRAYNQTARLSRAELLRKQVTAGFGHSCAIAFDNRVYCWGYNVNGQLGNNSYATSYIPVLVNTDPVINRNFITTIAAGSAHTCAADSSGNAYCWGNNYKEQIGLDKSTTTAKNPTLVSGLSGVTQLTAGDYHTCAIVESGRVYCWGSNGYGQLGIGATAAPDTCSDGYGCTNTPMLVTISGNPIIKSIISGHGHTCALDTTGKVYCWGENNVDQLGIASSDTCAGTDCSKSPIHISVLDSKGVVALNSSSGNGNAVCAITSAGTAYCWGADGSGQLGDGATTNRFASVTGANTITISGKKIIAMSVGDYHTCAITLDNLAYCWGANGSGQLGIGNYTTPVKTPTAVSINSSIKLTSIASGSEYTCALDANNKSYCWGDNSLGQFGNNNSSVTISNVPVATFVPPTTNVTF